MPDIKQAVEHESQAENLGWEPRVGDVVRAKGQDATLTITNVFGIHGRQSYAPPEPGMAEVFSALSGVWHVPLAALEPVPQLPAGSRADLGERCPDTGPPPARPIDANTAALIRAGEQREQAKPCPCGGAFEIKGAQLVCDKCGRAVRVKVRSQKQVTR